MTRVAVVGAGAIGGFLAAALARAGFPVAIVARGRHLGAIAQTGIRVHGDLGSFVARVEAGDDLRQLGDFDVLLLTFKSHQWPQLRAQLEPFAGRATLVTMQNGVPFWYVREPPLRSVDPGGAIGRLFSDETVVGSVVHVSGEIVEPGTIRQSGGLRYVFGEPGGGVSTRVTQLVDMFGRAGLTAESDPDVRATIWLKLINNAALNPVSVLRRMTIKQMLSDPQTREQVREMMSETLRVGEAMGIVAGVDLEQRLAYAARLSDVKTSMLQDYELGRSLELDPILGAVIELAARRRVEVPRLRAAYERLRNRDGRRFA